MKKKPSEKAKEQDPHLAVIDALKDKKGRYQDYWNPIYDECERHLEFTLQGKQFAKGEAAKYGITKPLEPNLLLTFANHEANKTLQTDYRGKVTPNGGGANDIQARERQQVLRGLQRVNNIEQVFNLVRRGQVCGGIQYSIAKVEYAGKRGFGKTLTDEYIQNYRNVFPDITVESCTFADMRDCLIKQDVSKSEWKEVTGGNPDDESWNGQKTKEVWHYWVREDAKDEELLGADGDSVMRSSLDEEKPDYSNVSLDEAGEPLGRETVDYTWCWYKIYEEKVLDEERWLGSYPPIVACTGRKVVSKDGKVSFQPLTQFAEEPQKLYTIIENIIALRLSRSPFSKWLIASDGIDVKQMIALRAASIVGDMDIVYKHVDAGGNPIPPPTEIQPYILDAILIQLQNEQRLKIQQIFGIFDANIGNRSNEQSGVAIRERAQGGELSNFDSQVNYMEYVQQVMRVKLDLIPKYLTAPQQMAFVDEDDKTVVKWLNQTGGVSFSPNEEYSLSIEAMPISQTAREDEAEALGEIFKMAPVLFNNPKALAILLKTQPGRGGQQIADIISGEDPEAQQAQAAIQELQGQLQQVTQQAQAMQTQAQAKQAQDALAVQGLKQTITGMKQQQALLKTMQDMEGMGEAAKAHGERIGAEMESQVKLLELQVSQYEAESGRITAEANMLKVVGGLAKPEPVTPKPGQGLP